MKINKSIAFVSDFDGTISKVDFFYHAIDILLTENDVNPWLDYKSGKIRHVEALRRIFSKIKVADNKFVDFVLSLPIEECFVDTVKQCKSKNIDFYIVSAGADYYINLILEQLKVKEFVTVISNPSIYSQDKGLLILEGDVSSPYYSIDYGISKKLAVESTRQNHDFIVFAGDGTPDIDAARLADKVFSRGVLTNLCAKNNINTTPFESYCEILEYLKNE